MVTLDLTTEGNALYIGRSVVRLEDIKEINTFSSNWARFLAVGYWLGTFPICTLILILRESYLPYATMRIVTPTLGCIALARAVLGSSFVVKAVFGFSYLFDFSLTTREQIGISIQSRRTKFTILTSLVSFVVVSTFFGFALVADWALVILAVATVSAFLYGGVSGCSHGLPIKPWVYLTTVEEGSYIRVKRKQRCPCVYWCNWCTEVHDTDEVLIVYPIEHIQFFSSLKVGSKL